MNTKQRRAKRRDTLKMADKFIEVFTEALNELESGKYTIDEMRGQLNEMKRQLVDIK